MRRAIRATFAFQCLLALLLITADVFESFLDPRYDVEFESPPSFPEVERPPGDTTMQPLVFIGSDDQPTFNQQPTVPDSIELTIESLDGFGDMIIINGGIEEGDADRFNAFISSLESVPSNVVINSPGGIVSDALSIGRQIRELDVRTLVLPGAYCYSACPYLFAGGTKREASRRGEVGVHQTYFEEPGYMPVFIAVESIQYGQAEEMKFLQDMGIGLELMITAMNTPPEEIDVLEEEELVSTNLATKIIA